ncbi:MAG: monofunctional biosynthetic peptidoglycan transglycosylase [Chitinophagaceae bacterium]
MKQASKPSTWSIAKKVFIWIFIIHMGWFLFFIWQKFSETDFVVANLKNKMMLLLSIIAAIVLLYIFVLKKIMLIKKTAILLREVFFILYISTFLYTVIGMVFNPLITFTQVGSLLQGYGLHRDYISYDAMGPNIKLAVIASEDQLYTDHDGFDLKAIKRALKYNKKHPNKIRGASTISQQTAKNIFLFQGGGFLRKGPEVFFTFTIETIWTKRMILERYLNCIEMGPGIFGVQAAAKTYFNKNARELSRTEAAQIAACLPNPKRINARGSYALNRAGDIVRQMGFLEPDPDIQDLIK